MARERKMSVVAAVKRDLDSIRKLDRDVAESALAASALVLAEQLDSPKNSATSKAMCAKSLIETLDRLHELAPDREEDDKVDEISARRAARLAGRPAA